MGANYYTQKWIRLIISVQHGHSHDLLVRNKSNSDKTAFAVSYATPIHDYPFSKNGVRYQSNWLLPHIGKLMEQFSRISIFQILSFISVFSSMVHLSVSHSYHP